MGEEKTTTEAEPEHDVPEVHYEPLVSLPAVETKTLEEEEEEMLKLRAKLYRYDNQSDEAEWKERGIGDVKILRHKETNACRVLMRRDKTLKICANHFVYPELKLTHNCGNEKTWVWLTPTDFADEEAKPEMLAIRFGSVEYAQKFKDKMEEAKEIMKKVQKDSSKSAGAEGDDVTKAMGALSVKENEKQVDAETKEPASDAGTDTKSCEDEKSEKKEKSQDKDDGV